MNYDPKKIEKRWQKKWEEGELFKAEDFSKKDKKYILIEFPYPSGAGLHVGHVRSYTALDVISRKLRMEGCNVMYPIGWDAFGLPTENYAIKNKIHPRIATEQNICTFTKQIKSLGISFDWQREINTTDPQYYKWTQWIFLKLYEHGLAYKASIPINWCPSCKIGLANEEVINGKCERCGAETEKRQKEQWMLAITKYAERLIKDLDTVNYLEKIKTQQINWIGKSDGASIKFRISTNKLQGENLKTSTSFKFRSHLITEILEGRKWVTFRMEKKDLKEGDIVSIIDWAGGDKEKQKEVAMGKITKIDEKKLNELPLDYLGHEKDAKNLKERKEKYGQYYNRKIEDSDIVYIYEFDLIKEIKELEVFTTRPDTLFGCTYMVVSPEHEIISNLKEQILNIEEVEEYAKKARKKSDLERTENKEKTGVEIKGIKAINPANGEKIPVFAADYVLAGYGTGAIMAVPAHDERDFEFAKKYGLPIREVVAPYKYDNPRSDKETQKRDVVTAIVKNPKNNKYLCLDWKTTEWKSFPTGGIDDDDLIDAAKREVKEETGYENLRFIRQIGDSIYAEFYRPHKDSNVFEHFKYLLFELEDDAQIEVSEEEKAQHEKVWLDEDQVESYINVWNQKLAWKRYREGDFAYTGEGININSGFLNGSKTEEGKEKMISWLEEHGIGKRQVQYKLRDWVFSRQRYWGEPIPLVFCENCAERIKNQLGIKNKEFSNGEILNPGWIEDKSLPVMLPDVESYEPTDTGESPLANVPEWVNTTCPKCGGPAKRETDTMPNWAGSSWYFLRYIDPQNPDAFADSEKLKYWMPIDLYNGGMEHTTLHLLYSRFWNKFLYDIGVVPCSEPYASRVSHGMVLAEDGKKMSKSLGNVINPDDVVQEFGADALRTYEMFMGPYAESIPWSTDGLKGVRRFLEKVWKLRDKVKKHEAMSNHEGQEKFKSLLHKTIKKVTGDIDDFKFNTAISAMMILANEMETMVEIDMEDYKLLVLILSPFAPHICEELWSLLHTPDPSPASAKLGRGKQEGNDYPSIFTEKWPSYDPELVKDETVELIIQINGKVRDKFEVPADISEEEAKSLVMEREKVREWTKGKEIMKVIFIKGKLVNIVLK